MNKKVDPLEFVIPASDNQGHSNRFWFRGNPQMAREVELMVTGTDFPYRTKGDLLRHAVHRHLKWLREQSRVTSVSQQVDLMINLMRDEELHADFLTVFEMLSTRISQHVSNGSEGEAIRLVRMAQDHIGGMPDSYWKDRYLRELEVKFGHLVKSSRKANLGSVEEDL